jgi:hypothetical protein
MDIKKPKSTKTLRKKVTSGAPDKLKYPVKITNPQTISSLKVSAREGHSQPIKIASKVYHAANTVTVAQSKMPKFYTKKDLNKLARAGYRRRDVPVTLLA